MNRFMKLLKMNGKLLCRNKGFLFALCIAPVLSVLFLNIKASPTMYEDETGKKSIIELKDETERVAYHSDRGGFSVKVYDASDSELTDYLLESTLGKGMFCICRLDASDMSEQKVLECAKEDAFNDRTGTILYVKKDFTAQLRKGSPEDGLQFYSVSDDERWKLFEQDFSLQLKKLMRAGEAADWDEKVMLGTLRAADEKQPVKNVTVIGSKGEAHLTTEQISHKQMLGYAYAIMTLGYVFCGVCVAYTIIEEKNNKVYTRLMLTRSGQVEYLASKFTMSILISAMQTAIGGIGVAIMDADFGMGLPQFLFQMFLLGLIFSFAGIVLGILIGDVMGANYAVFMLWSMSSMLSGLYFPIDTASAVLKTVAKMMPQYWFMESTNLIFTGDKTGYSMLLYITGAYFIFMMCVGVVGIRMKRTE